MQETADRTLLVREIPFRSLVEWGGRVGIAAGSLVGVVCTLGTLAGFEGIQIGFLGVKLQGWFATLIGVPISLGLSSAVLGALAWCPLRLWMARGLPMRLRLIVVPRPSERGAASLVRANPGSSPARRPPDLSSGPQG
ncbi:MAG: hypothetical protein IPK67_01185 [Planctomycetes bacterium]|nr:hypothetical protein [Planctomycetota bacterium]